MLTAKPFRRKCLQCFHQWSTRSYVRDAPRNHNPTFQYFILRAQGIKLYRNILRYLKPVDPDMRKELIATIRAEYDLRKDEKNLDKIRFFLAAGQRDFQKLQTHLNLTTDFYDIQRHPFFPYTMTEKKKKVKDGSEGLK